MKPMSHGLCDTRRVSWTKEANHDLQDDFDFRRRSDGGVLRRRRRRWLQSCVTSTRRANRQGGLRGGGMRDETAWPWPRWAARSRDCRNIEVAGREGSIRDEVQLRGRDGIVESRWSSIHDLERRGASPIWPRWRRQWHSLHEDHEL